MPGSEIDTAVKVLESNKEMLSLKRQLEELGLQVNDPQARTHARIDKLGWWPTLGGCIKRAWTYARASLEKLFPCSVILFGATSRLLDTCVLFLTDRIHGLRRYGHASEELLSRLVILFDFV